MGAAFCCLRNKRPNEEDLEHPDPYACSMRTVGGGRDSADSSTSLERVIPPVVSNVDNRLATPPTALEQADSESELRNFALNAMLTKEHGFVSSMRSRIRQMTLRSFGGTVILNSHPDQSMESLTSHGIAVNSSMEETDIAELFDPQTRYHDGAVIVDMAREGEFAPVIRSSMNQLVVNPNIAMPAGLNGRGMRYRSAYGASNHTDALIIVVSEERRTISLFHRGTMQLDIQLDALESRLRLTSGSLLNQKWANARNTAMILENCVQSVFEKAVSRHTFTYNLPPHLEANHLDRACLVLLRRFGRFETSRLVLRFGEARVEVNVYRFSDNSTVIDESLFASDAFRRALSDEAQIESIARQLAAFFAREWWTSGNCTFYVPYVRDVDHAAALIIDQLAATRKCQLLKKPFGQHLLQYDFCIKYLLRRWALLGLSETGEEAQSCSKDLIIDAKHGSDLAYKSGADGAFDLPIESDALDVSLSDQKEEPSKAGHGLVPVLIDDVAFHIENINFDSDDDDDSLSNSFYELSFENHFDSDDEPEDALVDS